MKIYVFLLALLLSAGCAHVIDGKWEATFSGGMGGQPMTVTYNFSVDGDTLRGTVSGGPDQWIAIRNGKIEGNNISFDFPLDMGRLKMTVVYTGELSGDELKLTLTFKMEEGSGGGPDDEASGNILSLMTVTVNNMPPVSLVAKRVQ